ncbi:MAG: iron-containing alcohol dehydrogenase, partial [Patescibacteria group bacterium]|nr:iron-containing alcohol dehydrogenase [Patescibacteria group bacterium]
CGSSRPASDAEHLISHAFDQTAACPKAHGLQVGLAAYMVSRLQGENTDLIAGVFDRTGFWQAVRNDPLSRREWLRAIDVAPSIKPDRYTILSSSPRVHELAVMIDEDSRLAGCFVD